MKEALAIASLVASVSANIPYVIETLQKKVKPERISWLLWTLLGSTYYFSALFGDGATYFTFGELIGPVTVFVLSLKFGVGGKSRFDMYSLAVALVAFCLLFIVDNVILSLLLALIVDSIGATLTIRKLLLDPASESRGFWLLGAISALLAILSLRSYSLEALLFPVYVLILSTFIFIKASPAKEQNIERIEEL